MPTTGHPETTSSHHQSRSPGSQLLTSRNFGFLFWGQLTSQIGDTLNRVALLGSAPVMVP